MLLLLDEHLGTDEIAQRLFISEHTVRSHVKSRLKKLGVSSRREASTPRRRSRRLALALESVEDCFDEAGKGLEVVAALEHGRDSWPERSASSRHVPEPVGRHGHLGQRVVSVRVEAGGDEDEVRVERTHRRLDHLDEGSSILVVARARAEGHVDDALRVRFRAHPLPGQKGHW